MLKAIGTKLYDGGVEVRLIGVNDTTVHACEIGVMTGDLPIGYQYGNHNLPQYPFPGSSNSDADCKIPSNSYKEFWYKYCWLLKNSLGGAISNAKDHTLTGTTYLNHLRAGTPDVWGRDIFYRAFKNPTYRSRLDAKMIDLLDMARANGIYINLTIAGGGSESNGAFGAGQFFVVTDPAFENYVQYCADYINAYGWHAAIACIDLNNEPVNYNGDGHDLAGRSTWWDNKFGRTIVQYNGHNYEMWEAKYLEWKDTLLTQVRSRLTIDPAPLIIIGGGNFAIFWGTWPGHTQADVDWEKTRTLDYAANSDMTVGHGYAQAEYNDAIAWGHQTTIFVNKPGYGEEYGFGEQGPPWRYSYWSWYDLMHQQGNASQCTMVLEGMVDPAPIGKWPNQMAYPGYPLTKVDDWTYKNAQGTVFTIPPVPTAPPEPPPTPPTVVTVTLPPVKQGTLVISMPTLTATLPPVVVSSKTVVVPAKTIPTVIPAQRVKSFWGTVTIPAQTVNVNIPATTVVVPGEVIHQPKLVLPMPSVTTQLPDIVIPPFEVK
jgi:hypothetical protein